MELLAWAAGFALFFIVLRFLERHREIRAFWLGRVALGAVVGLLLARLSVLWTRFDDVLANPALVLNASVGLAGWFGGLFAFAGVAMVSLLQLRRTSDEARSWPLMASVGAGIALAAGLLVLAPRAFEGPPELHTAVPDLEGRPHTLAEWNGKVTILNFWATWCPPCLAEMPDLKTFAASGPSALLIGVDAAATEKDGVAGVVKFAADNKLSWTQLADRDGLLQKAYDVAALPTTVVLDAKGRVIARREGAVDAAWLASFNVSGH